MHDARLLIVITRILCQHYTSARARSTPRSHGEWVFIYYCCVTSLVAEDRFPPAAQRGDERYIPLGQTGLYSSFSALGCVCLLLASDAVVCVVLHNTTPTRHLSLVRNGAIYSGRMAVVFLLAHSLEAVLLMRYW
jgi:hypothetical protein